MRSLEQQRYGRLLAVGGHTGLIRIDERAEKKLERIAQEAQEDRKQVKVLNALWQELQGLGFKEGFVLQLLDENAKNVISGTIVGFNKHNGLISLKTGRSTNLVSGKSEPVKRIRVSRLMKLLSKEAERNTKNP